MRRHTLQKELILNAVRTLRSHVTAEDVYNYIVKDYPHVGKGTVYRNLSILADEGQIRRVEIPNASDRFDFTLEDHYHIRCTKCGCVEDVDLEYIPDMLDRVGDSKGFQFLGYDILFRGLCEKCKKIQQEGVG